MYDVFICHASENKDEFVRPLARRLRDRGVNVWYDEFSLTPGHSLRKSIDQGLSGSRYGVVVLSKQFFSKNWPQWELGALVQGLLGAQEQSLVPVWLKVSHDEVRRFSPSIADLVAIESDHGLDHVVDEIIRVVKPGRREMANELTEILISESGTPTRRIRKHIVQMLRANGEMAYSEIRDGCCSDAWEEGRFLRKWRELMNLEVIESGPGTDPVCRLSRQASSILDEMQED